MQPLPQVSIVPGQPARHMQVMQQPLMNGQQVNYPITQAESMASGVPLTPQQLATGQVQQGRSPTQQLPPLVPPTYYVMQIPTGGSVPNSVAMVGAPVRAAPQTATTGLREWEYLEPCDMNCDCCTAMFCPCTVVRDNFEKAGMLEDRRGKANKLSTVFSYLVGCHYCYVLGGNKIYGIFVMIMAAICTRMAYPDMDASNGIPYFPDHGPHETTMDAVPLHDQGSSLSAPRPLLDDNPIALPPPQVGYTEVGIAADEGVDLQVVAVRLLMSAASRATGPGHVEAAEAVAPPMTAMMEAVPMDSSQEHDEMQMHAFFFWIAMVYVWVLFLNPFVWADFYRVYVFIRCREQLAKRLNMPFQCCTWGTLLRDCCCPLYCPCWTLMQEKRTLRRELLLQQQFLVGQPMQVLQPAANMGEQHDAAHVQQHHIAQSNRQAHLQYPVVADPNAYVDVADRTEFGSTQG